jgi:hypothetical protein
VVNGLELTNKLSESIPSQARAEVAPAPLDRWSSRAKLRELQTMIFLCDFSAQCRPARLFGAPLQNKLLKRGFYDSQK